ncbi:hypothetical protein [Neorhizobium galegae]|uniref:Uncharacterized protein n=1 Tax=Neorhizobium galegae bv. orientalis str. HAMBI 540 TaxID=1028800 RepID=A0A068SQW0_NEOGA|nr:Hypothetical protein RG540_CH20750 [Neorhizobium galegae bv. orientalis str. HAMBI 540]
MNDKWLGTPPDVIIPRLRSLLTDLENLAVPNQFAGVNDAVIIRHCMMAQRSVPCLIGEMTGHPHIRNGPGITSELFYLDRKRQLARTLSHWYRFDQGLL